VREIRAFHSESGGRGLAREDGLLMERKLSGL
jgi:hypothetical protein